jgi:hypothetical protein
MNLSRPEQYFAEFLSALEKNDPRDRLISLSESQLPNAPALLVEGRRIRVPHNVWFVGTANHDETTNEFADKTYDRAHVMTLPRHEAGFKIEPKPKASFSYGSLMERFDAAVTQNADEVAELLAELTTGRSQTFCRIALTWDGAIDSSVRPCDLFPFTWLQAAVKRTLSTICLPAEYFGAARSLAIRCDDR